MDEPIKGIELVAKPDVIPPASVKFAAEGKIIFDIEYEDKIYENKNDFKLYKFLKELFDLEGGKEIFDKYEAFLDTE